MKKLFVIMVAAFAFVACQEEKKAEPTTEERVENYLNDLYKAAEDCDAEKFEALSLEFEEYLMGLSEEEYAKADEFAVKWGEENAMKFEVIDLCMTYGVPEDFEDEVDDYYDEVMEDAEDYYDEAMEDAEKYYDEALEDAEEYYEAATKAAEKYVDDAMEAADDYVNDALEAAAAYGL